MDVKCCRHQHEVLVTYIRYELRCWGRLDDLHLSYWIDDTVSASKRSSWIQVTPALQRVLMRARILSEDCCKELPPLKAVLCHAYRSQAFADVVQEIRRCTLVVYNNLTARGVSDPKLNDFLWQAKIGRKERLLLEKAEQQDWQHLLQELQSYYDRHDHCNAEDCGNEHVHMDPRHCLATQAFQRFFFQQTGGSELDYKSLLWSFNPEVVKLGRPLGSGTYAFVMEVTWLGFKYAQKFFNVAGVDSLPAEAKALAKLNHPHIVKVYAYSEETLLMDLMSTDLHKFMKSRMKGGAKGEPFSLRAAMDLMFQIADAMDYLHSQKVAHRDLKPSNILVNPVNLPGVDEDDEDGGFVFAKIADFGLAKVKRDITRYSHLTRDVGTRRWMAPEIFKANKDDDHLEHAFPMKADVYSFGIICFEILTGQQPFSDEPASTLYSKLTAPIPLRPQLPLSCPKILASLICECWDADPRKRPEFGDVCGVLASIKDLPIVIAAPPVLQSPENVITFEFGSMEPSFGSVESSFGSVESSFGSVGSSFGGVLPRATPYPLRVNSAPPNLDEQIIAQVLVERSTPVLASGQQQNVQALAERSKPVLASGQQQNAQARVERSLSTTPILASGEQQKSKKKRRKKKNSGPLLGPE